MPKSSSTTKSTNGKKKINGINVNLRIVAEKLQRGLSLGKKSSSACTDHDHHGRYGHEDNNIIMDEIEEVEDSTTNEVPEDVKEGHFAVIAVDDYELKRFVVPLSCLTHPTFLRLLEQAAEEYGFDREGALTIPCKPSEVERILMDDHDQHWMEAAGDWNPRSTNMVIKSC